MTESARDQNADVIIPQKAGAFSGVFDQLHRVDRKRFSAAFDMNFKELSATLLCSPWVLREKPEDPELLHSAYALVNVMNELAEYCGERRFALHWLWHSREAFAGKTGREFLFAGGLMDLIPIVTDIIEHAQAVDAIRAASPTRVRSKSRIKESNIGRSRSKAKLSNKTPMNHDQQ